VAELVRFMESSSSLPRPGSKSRATRPLIVLFGDHAARPAGLERDLLRAGFQVSEADVIENLPARPALVVATCTTLAGDRPQLNEAFTSARATGAQVVVLIAEGEPEDLIRAAEAGADEAILLPIEAPLLVTRLRARLVAPRMTLHGPGGSDLKLFEILQDVATELHREEMLHALVRSLAAALDVRSVSCVLHSDGSETGRLVAATDAPKVRDVDVELARWPDAVAALAAAETVFVRDAGSEPMFEAIADRTLSAQHGEPETAAAIPLAPLGRPIGTVVLRTRRGEAPLTAGAVAFAELAVAATARLIETDDRRGSISRRQAMASHVDPLTGCGTLDALDRRIREEFERSRRYDVTFALVLLDVDGMRLINERLGRDGGHRVLADLGRLLQRELRSPDFVARYGGEEFVLLLPETDLEGAALTVNRIREKLVPAGLGELHLGVRCHLTAGVAVYPHASVHKPEDLFAMVEQALLAGKAQDEGRIGSAA
jgi:diguanylate cyclase (GGDEF)-like protein